MIFHGRQKHSNSRHHRGLLIGSAIDLHLVQDKLSNTPAIFVL